MYWYLPNYVMKVVASLDSGTRGILWNPFQQSRTDFTITLGTLLTRLKGLGVWWVSLLDTRFSACKSTVLLGDPSALAVTTILEH